ncbi:hypothetical protein DK926_01790 [Rhodococcus sp. Eu-32]|uniref:hypothetical protein n=1 Tax=Rhodococcus sp. Eu-32 TaxID=1017319 RepID=UPI000DF29CAD|nr:hypothetical protein [Rhodococcus sp. Eu-32]RRQ29628.1 hypothetical protein DK926_01790 [Rhodococcus sp. Eu-32]
MENSQTKALVAALTATGACVGLGAAVVWRSAVPHGTDAVDYFSRVRPSWFPATLYLVAGGVAVALLLSSFLIDAGLRISSDRHRSRIGLFVLLLTFGAALGTGAAALWTIWPPQPVDHWDDAERLVEFGWTAITFADDDVSTSFRPTIAHPWVIFPAGGAAIAGLLALSLSLRDLRLTGRD